MDLICVLKRFIRPLGINGQVAGDVRVVWCPRQQLAIRNLYLRRSSRRAVLYLLLFLHLVSVHESNGVLVLGSLECSRVGCISRSRNNFRCPAAPSVGELCIGCLGRLSAVVRRYCAMGHVIVCFQNHVAILPYDCPSLCCFFPQSLEFYVLRKCYLTRVFGVIVRPLLELVTCLGISAELNRRIGTCRILVNRYRTFLFIGRGYRCCVG